MNNYEKAHHQVWSQLANWQKEALTEDRKLKKNTSLMQEFVKQVMTLAETMPENDLTPEKVQV